MTIYLIVPCISCKYLCFNHLSSSILLSAMTVLSSRPKFVVLAAIGTSQTCVASKPHHFIYGCFGEISVPENCLQCHVNLFKPFADLGCPISKSTYVYTQVIISWCGCYGKWMPVEMNMVYGYLVEMDCVVYSELDSQVM